MVSRSGTGTGLKSRRPTASVPGNGCKLSLLLEGRRGMIESLDKPAHTVDLKIGESIQIGARHKGAPWSAMKADGSEVLPDYRTADAVMVKALDRSMETQ